MKEEEEVNKEKNEKQNEIQKESVFQDEKYIKFLFLFRMKPSNKFIKNISLKKASILLSFICCIFPVIQLIMDYIFMKYLCVICPFFNFFLCASLNILAFFYFIKAYKQINPYKDVYKGYLAISWSFIIHFVLFIIDIFFDLSFFPIDLFFILNNEFKLISFFLPGLLFLTFEFYTSWIIYSYSKYLIDATDPLIKGENVLFNDKKDIDDNNIKNHIELSDKGL